jgi:hypothetical protein
MGTMVNRMSLELAAQIEDEVERALEAQPTAVRLALKQAMAEQGATLRWEPNAENPTRLVVVVAGRDLLEVTLVRPVRN